jgi:antitoxin component YwqK of YwqJK toxin-antitoxin module
MKTYSRRGKLLQECDYKDGLKNGKFIIYDKRGRVVAEKKFKDGMQIIEGTTNGSGSFTPGR